MKKLLIFITVLIVSCSKSDPKSTPDIDVPIENETYDKDGITRKSESVTFEVFQYNTRIDTTRITPTMEIGWGAALADGDSIVAEWDVPSAFQFFESSKKERDDKIKKWVSFHTISISSPVPVSAVVKVSLRNLKSGKMLSRQQAVTIKYTVKNFDIFRVNFGMTKAEVKENEFGRLVPKEDSVSKWVEKSANLALIDGPGDPYVNAYEFDGSKLKYIHVVQNAGSEENTEYMSSETRNQMIALAQRYGGKVPVFEEKIIGSETRYKTNDKVSWTENGIRFTYGMRNVLIAKKALNYYTLTYEKVS